MKDIKLVIVVGIITVIIGIVIFCFLMHYYNVRIDVIIKSFVAMVVLMLIVGGPAIYGEKKIELVEQRYKLDITNKNNISEHIRINENNILVKYKDIMRYWYIYPSFFSKIMLKGSLFEFPTYKIEKKIQLTEEDLDNITMSINELNNDMKSGIIVNYKGIEKQISIKDINSILGKYNVKI